MPLVVATGARGAMARPDKVRIDLSSPRWDQSTLLGRLRHFMAITDPKLLLPSDEELQKAVAIVAAHRQDKISIN